jgi:Clp amino terminal domain, pathogenicity island component
MEQLPARLDELISYVKSQDGTPLDHVSEAVQVSQRLDELADHLVGHFVDQARRAGASWTEIGQAMGVSKQAAQKRFVPKADDDWQGSLKAAFAAHPFSRFTDRARRTVTAAQEEARSRGFDYLGTEHLALGLLHEPDGLAVKAIEGLGVSAETVRDALVAALPQGSADVPVLKQIPFTPKAKKVMELAVRDALQLNHNYIGTEHLLLGVLDVEDGLGATTLAGLGITRDRATEWLVPELQRLLAAKQELRP